ncbi:MAG TPA: hypothetical protein VKX39_04450 [Bryobacteraceae bacterium]|nr:hypothetical protein [Bryobacteraceae bacterium]
MQSVPGPIWSRPVAIAAVASVWLAMTALFWVGYAGADDMFYARYAFLFHRPPINWWEFRIPAILAIRAAFLLFGPSAFSAALPSLVASLAILFSVAWIVHWPAKLNWQTTGAMLVAATMPFDVGARSTAGAITIATGLLALGTACLLQDGPKTRWAGAALFALAFSTHELSIFYIGIFCLAALLIDRKRFLGPVIACLLFSLCLALIEAAVYKHLVGDALARFRMSASESANQAFDSDPDTNLTGLAFFLWPVRNLFFGKAFGCDLILTLIAGLLAWKFLFWRQKLLFLSAFLTWAWLGYGTKVPWAYKPLYREIHYYGIVIVAIAVVLPASLAIVFRHRPFWAGAILLFALAVQFACSAAGGRWGDDVKISGDLLNYARLHPSQVFLTDVATMNQMYVVNGFRLPENVICENGSAVRKDLLVNKEPPGAPVFTFPERPVQGILINRDVLEMRGAEPEFTRFLRQHPGPRTVIAPLRYKPWLRPLLPLAGPRPFLIKSQGGELVTIG